MKIRGPYASGLCRVNGVKVEFRDYIADVPDAIGIELIQKGRGKYSDVVTPMSQEKKDLMYYEFNRLIRKIKKTRKFDNLLVTISIGEIHRKLGEVTSPTMQAYCIKYGIDFVQITIQDPYLTPYWQRYRLAGLLEVYDRIIYMDDDIIIKKTAPNLFNIVPYDHVALYKEGNRPSKFWDRNNYCWRCFQTYLTEVLKRPYDPTKYNGDHYYNNGIIAFSREHKKLFILPDVEEDIDWAHDPSTKGSLNVCGDQTNLNINLIDNKYKVFELQPPLVGLWDRVPDEYNYTDCEIVHFAFGGMDDTKIQQIKAIKDSV